MQAFDLMSSDHFHVILHSDEEHGLIFNRLDGSVNTINYDDAKNLANLKHVESIYGIVGHFLNKYLVLIRSRTYVGTLHEPRSCTNHDIYMINQVRVIDIANGTNTNDPYFGDESSKMSSVRYNVASSKNESDNIGLNDLGASQQSNSSDFASLPITISTSSYASRSGQWNPFRLASNLRPMMPRQFLRSGPSVNSDSSNEDETKVGPSQLLTQPDESDKRLVEEMIKLFNNTNSFYFSPTLDLTRRFACKNLVRTHPNDATWRTADERFFWNKHMLKDLIELSEKNSDANYFIYVILQGFISIENLTIPIKDHIIIERGIPATNINTLKILSGNNVNCDNNLSDSSDGKVVSDLNFAGKKYQMVLISRRSVFHAGTRYRRRGCNDEGDCANFVETEQIFRYNRHFKSLVLVRGSIPLYWYQTGLNYRPPPVLTRGEQENREVFEKHFIKLFEAYGTDRIISVDCTEKTGRERALHDAYRRHTDQLSEKYPSIKLIEFDFHRHCKGRQRTDSQIEKHLIECGLTDQIMKDAKYYWNDGEVVLNQMGVFRVNCLDCSDRTNLVQRIIALRILDLQLARLGIISPDTRPEDNECRKIMQIMWSANGNVLSTQYCGTRALFGGDRKLSAYIKDTYSSASRYYISKFRDAYRQAAIDAMLGIESVETKSLRAGRLRDYDFVNFDPILASRAGGSILKDVGSKVSNRFARLKGHFNIRPTGAEIAGRDRAFGTDKFEEDEPELIDDGLDAALDKLNIDWPSSESIGNERSQGDNLFARLSQADDCFQDDDEFGQLTLSIDVSELQRLRARKSDNNQSVSNANNSPEEIGMTENRSLKSKPENPAETTTSSA